MTASEKLRKRDSIQGIVVWPRVVTTLKRVVTSDHIVAPPASQTLTLPVGEEEGAIMFDIVSIKKTFGWILKLRCTKSNHKDSIRIQVTPFLWSRGI